jgi:hypothetical protein
MFFLGVFADFVMGLWGKVSVLVESNKNGRQSSGEWWLTTRKCTCEERTHTESQEPGE